MTDTPDEAMALLEAEDRDRALSLVFAPQKVRADLAALYAVNVESARVRDQVSQPMLGEIRLQWWRDTLTDEANSSSGNPVAAALLGSIHRHDLPRAAFDRFFEARIFDLYDDPMPDRAAFEAYAGETASTLIVLAATILSRSDADRIADAAGHAGVAQAVAGVLRLLPVHRARRQVYIPKDMLSAVGCSTEELIAGSGEAPLRAVSAMVAFGREHAKAAHEHYAAVPASVRPAFLPALLAVPYLDRIERAGSDIFNRPVEIGPLSKSYRYWRSMRG
ncbi:phytoene/squalene synthase family protein [Aurantimonas sp. VKM B-3413]|uniref:phytoene/squalene synthase family protein n=1 Tax=Aurantimonas sp. VKM B-3413 TaxID=2779401 RepID=UPI001E486297|nr:phytoene/squalene synthase family protein [Aurantimonas sp. VKM B-3413]MCB8836686.1 squalene/phytoene synthase family protein [Aurantimonas sp. VKM B-3413]